MKRLVTLILAIAIPLFAGLREESEQALRNYLQSQNIEVSTTKFEWKAWALSPALSAKYSKKSSSRFISSKLDAWIITLPSKEHIYAVLDHVLGKVQPISFLVILDANGQVLQTVIVKYRESIGGQVSHPKWLQQFQGKTSTSNWMRGKDIDGISGATMSVDSIIRGVYRQTLLFPFLKSLFP